MPCVRASVRAKCKIRQIYRIPNINANVRYPKGHGVANSFAVLTINYKSILICLFSLSFSLKPFVFHCFTSAIGSFSPIESREKECF